MYVQYKNEIGLFASIVMCVLTNKTPQRKNMALDDTTNKNRNQ